MTQLGQLLFATIGLARIARVIPSIPDPTASPVKGALLELMLPALHLLNAVAVLDEALSDYVEVRNIPWPPKTRRDLFNRKDVVAKALPGLDAQRLHRVRELRNSVAHASDSQICRALTWTALDDALVDVAGAFVALGLIERIPDIVAFYERHPTLFLDDLGPGGERMRHRHRVGAKIDDDLLMEFSYEIAYLPPDAR
jgi:hypothetical protein